MSRARTRIEPKADRCGPTGKRRFRSASAASIALETAQERATQDDNRHAQRRREVRFYSCDLCGGWHLTSLVL